MTTPNNSISSIGLSDVNVELNFPANNPRRFNDGIFRNLTGNAQRTVPDSPIAISELSAKTAFGGIISANSANVTSYGTIQRTITLVANTDMYSPDILWQANVVSGTPGVFVVNGKSATYTVTGTPEVNVSSNVQISATLSFQGHTIGIAQKYISFEINSLPPLLFVNGNTEANSVVFEPTSASTTLTASANAPGSTIQFVVTPNDSGVLISGNTVTLSSQATLAGQNNVRSYSVMTNLIFNQEIIASDLKIVTVRANYATPDFTYTVPASSNNNFANTGTIHSSLLFTAVHSIPGANMAWSATKVSGDDAVLTVAPDLGSANLHVNVASGVFTTKKSIYDVTATLQYSNGQFITSKTERVTLRTGAYGLSFNPAANVSASGYTAQTASSFATASYLAGTLTWNIARVSGNVATVSNTVIAGSGTATVSLPIDAVGTSNAVYRINPVLMFDGVIMANVASQTSLSAQQLAYTFTLSGNTSNTVLGAAPVVSSLVTTATHDIANGTVTWAKSTSPSLLSANGLVATTSYTNSTIGSDTFTLSATLLDAQGRTVEIQNRTLTLRAYDPIISFAGSNNVTSVSFADPTATANVVATARAGADTLNVTASKLTGADLVFNSGSGNSSIRAISLVATRSTLGTTEGLYRLTANVTWFGVSNSRTYDVSVSATKDNPNFTLGGTGETKSSFNFPVVSNGTFTAAHSIPGGTITWTRTINSGGITDNPVSNATSYVIRTSQGSVGTLSANVTVTATLRDAAGAYVNALSNTVFISSTVSNPLLALNGPASNTVSNTFTSSASIVLTPSVAAGLVGHTYQFSWAAVSGAASVSSNSSAVLLVANYDGVGQASGTYDVTCNVVLSGQTIASTTRRVTVTAICPAPTLNIVSSNNELGSYNFPVSASAITDTSSTPPGAVVSWTWNLVSGPAGSLSTANSNYRFIVTASTSSYGVVNPVYDLTATYRTPAGSLLGTRTVRVSALAERINPGLSWQFVNGISSNTVTGFDNVISASVNLQAAVSSPLFGHSYQISATKVSGSDASIGTNNTAGSATMTLTNTASVEGTNQKSATYDFYCSLVYNAQVIAGPVVQRGTATVIPGSITVPNPIYAQQITGAGIAAAAITFNPDTTLTYTNGTPTNWMNPPTPAQAANYQIYFTQSLGAANTTSTPMNTWLDLTTTRQLADSVRPPSKFPDNLVSRDSQGTYQIRNKNTLAVVASGNWRIYVQSGIN